MSKQKEIREELIKFFTPPNTTFKGNPILEENITQVVDELLELEDRLGVVIRDGDVGEVKLEGGCFDQVSEDYRGIIAYIKPLIKEGE